MTGECRKAAPDGRPRAKFRAFKSECAIVVLRFVSLSSSRFPGDIFGQKGREAIGHGHHNKEA
jgi:hypothetical protein